MNNNHSDQIQKAKCPAPEDIVACLCNELELSEKTAVERHIATCAACRNMADELGVSIRELRQFPADQDLRRDLTDEILRKIPVDAWSSGTVPVAADTPRFGLLLRLAACIVILFGAAIIARSWMRGSGQTTSGSISVADAGNKDSSGIAGSRQLDAKSAALKDTRQWLASVQEPSGRWDAVGWGGKKEYMPALNGLALLTFARNPELTKENAAVIDRAAKYMVSCQGKSGLFGEEVEGMMYNHGIVTVALFETYAATRDISLKASLDKAIGFIRKQQLATGGWSYANRPDATANTSVAVWQLQALLLSAKLGWADQDHSLRKGLRWLGSMIDDGGQFGYDRPKKSPEGTMTLTAMGAFCMFTASETESSGNREMLLQLKRVIASSKIEDVSSDFYRCYFRAAAFNTAKTEECDLMLANLQRSLLVAQERVGKNAGSWSPGDRWGSTGGRIYSTAVAALALEL